MATLNDLRTKGGVIVTIVIAVGLVAFLLGDLFSSGSNIFSSRANRVGTINGKNIDYQEFLVHSENVKNIYAMSQGSGAFDSEAYDAIYQEAWNDMIMTYSFQPSFQNMGLTISEAEMKDMVNGNFISPVFNASPEVLYQFLEAAQTDPVAYQRWNYFKKVAAEQRLMGNYSDLVAAGFYANALDVENATKAANTASNAKIVTKPYFMIADSLVAEPTSSEIKKYYDEHKELFRRDIESRAVEYVVFPVDPSEADYAAAKAEVEALAAEFKAAENVFQFAAAETHDSMDERYYSESNIPAEYKAYAFGNKRGQMYGPVQKGDRYTMARVSDIRMMPDEIGASHILLPYSEMELVDSIETALKKGADFAELAQKYSMDTASAVNGGDLGRFAPEAMVSEFSDALLAAKKNQIVRIESEFGVHIAKLTYSSKPIRKAQVATIVYEVVASDATIQQASNKAGEFLAAIKKSNFNNAVAELSLVKRNANIGQYDRNVMGFTNARELVRWAYNNKVGEVSSAMEIDGDYVVAVVAGIKEQGYAPVKEVSAQIARQLRMNAKAEYVAAQVKDAATIEEAAQILGAEVLDAAEVLGNASSIVGVGPDAKLVGAIANAAENELGTVAGNSGAYVYVVTGRNTLENSTAESAKPLFESTAVRNLQNNLGADLNRGAEVEDNRVRFF